MGYEEAHTPRYCLNCKHFFIDKDNAYNSRLYGDRIIPEKCKLGDFETTKHSSCHEFKLNTVFD